MCLFQKPQSSLSVSSFHKHTKQQKHAHNDYINYDIFHSTTKLINFADQKQYKIMSYNTYTLDNGLRVIHKNTGANVSYCGFAINVGTRDEKENEHGMAHLVEHMIFKGTTNRRAWHILNRMESVGGEINAYTNKEETVVYSAFLKQDLPRAVDLLCDIVFNSTFPEKEIEKEVDVIIDEILSYEDNPSELIYDDFEDALFAGCSLGRNILGTPKALKSFTRKDVLSFVRKYYTPSNMVFFLYGDGKDLYLKRMLENRTQEVSAKNFKIKRKTPEKYIKTNNTLYRATNQAHVLIGNRTYSAKDKKRTPLFLLNNILGGPGMNSRLNVELREKRGYVYNVESSLASYTDTGVFATYFGTDAKRTDRCVEIILKEFDKFKNNKLTSTQLQAAKKQLIGQIAVSKDNNENNALAMAKMFLHFNVCEPSRLLYEKINNITAEEIMDVANDIFSDDMSFLIYK